MKIFRELPGHLQLIACDVLIVGGGPAGSVAAILLARGGARVLLVERSRYDVAGRGEMLPPAAIQQLRRLNLAACLDGCSVPCTGLVTHWGATLSEVDYLFNPLGEGAILARPRFDAALCIHAASTGAEVLTETNIRSCVLADSGYWDAVLRNRGGETRVHAVQLIDAAGRKNWPGRPSPERRRFDRLVAIVAHFRMPSNLQPDPRPIIEANPGGWCYSSIFPGGNRVVLVFTDIDLIVRCAQGLQFVWEEALQCSPRTAESIDGAARVCALRVIAADTSQRRSFAGKNWLAAGDAAATWDPLCAAGIFNAISHAEQTAAVILHGSPPSDVQAYRDKLRADFETYRKGYRYYYGIVRRFPHSPFWQRRAQRLIPRRTSSVKPIVLPSSETDETRKEDSAFTVASICAAPKSLLNR